MKTKRRNAMCLLTELLLGGLVCIFPSCDDGVGNRAPGQPLSATLSVSCLPFGADSEALARGAGLQRRVPETVEIPLEDRWILSATLEEEEVSPVRADYDGINDGAKFIVVAYEVGSGGSPQHDEYTYNATTQQLERSGATPIELTAGKKYKYVHYSYNSTTTVPGYGTTINVTPYSGTATNNDLLWGAGGGPTGLGLDEAINVSLEHKFTRVKLKIGVSGSASVNLSSISADFDTNRSGVFTVADGEFMSNTAETAQAFSLTGGQISASTFVESEYRMVYAADRPIVKVKMSGKIGNTSFSDVMATFAGPLGAGNSYVLRVRFRQGPRWAGSNIYWDSVNQCLTFAPYDDVDKTKQNYQGVFFQWGSLVGISAAMTSNATPWNEESTVVYVPVYGGSVNPTSSSWLDDVAKVFNYSVWHDVPSLYGENITANCGPNVDYFASYSDYGSNLGDICRYLGHTGSAPSDYRMPTKYELIKGNNDGSLTSGVDHGSWSGNSMGQWTRIGGDSWTPVSSNGGLEDGTYTGLTTGAKYGGYATFPAAGFRTTAEGMLSNVGFDGYYWSSSAISGTEGAHLLYITHATLSEYVTDRRRGRSVRCILDE